MPRHLISDVHEWMNEIPTVPGCSLANPQPRERAWADRRGKKTLLNLTLVTRDCEGATEVKSKWETSVAVQHHYSDRTSLLTSKANERTMKARKRAARSRLPGGARPVERLVSDATDTPGTGV